MSKDRDKGKTIDIRCSHDFTGRPEKHAKSCPMYKEYPSAHGNSGGGYKGGLGGYSGSNSGQTKINPQVAKQITDKISTSESAIQNEIGRLKGLNPIASEETLRSAAIQELGIATFEELLELKSYQNIVSTRPSDSLQEKALAVNVAQKITPYVLSLNSGEWSLGIHTASSEGRKSKDSTYGLSNQVMICLEHLKIYGGADKLKVLTFTECDLTTSDMIYFGNTMLQYPLLLKYLDFSYNRIGDIGTISFINSFITDPKGKYPIHNIINLNLSNNNIGDDGVGHISAYINNGYMPSLKVLHLEGNNLNFNSNPKIIKLVQNVKQDIKILVSKMSDIIDGTKKQGKLFFGSKEDKQEIVKGFLKQSQENGVDVDNITVSKNIVDALKNSFKLGFNFSIGWSKCSIIPNDLTSFAVDKTTVKISKKVGVLKNYIDVANCYFETFDESASSKEGVQFMADVGLVGNGGFVDSIE
ncbi:MAG: hypothetical protein HQ490_04810 [Lutibacter sp.]|nr:hypothetical protein [Lutibacter sp.]